MEKFELNITSNGMDGEGIAKKDGIVFFVDDAVAGDSVVAEITKKTSKFYRAKIDTVLKPSTNRIKAPCPYYYECGGCKLQHINYDYQLKIKQQNIQNLLDKNKIRALVNNTIASKNIFGYRNKLTLYATNKNALGFYKNNSSIIVPINNCLLVSEEFNNLIKIINKYLITNKEFAFILKGLAIREIAEFKTNLNCYLINLILKEKTDLKLFNNYLKINKINYSLYFCINKKSNIPTYPCKFVGGKDSVLTSENNIVYPVYPMSFLQVNNHIKEQIYLDVLKEIKNDDVVLDAYAGAGLLSAIISKKAKQVYAVEIDKQASLASKKLQEINQINNMQSILGDCGVVVPKLVDKVKLNAVVLDPARKGVDTKNIDAILKSNAQNVIYISCNPATLARDLSRLKNVYNINYVQPYDMFPQTSEVETVVKLTKIKQKKEF